MVGMQFLCQNHKICSWKYLRGFIASEDGKLVGVTVGNLCTVSTLALRVGRNEGRRGEREGVEGGEGRERRWREERGGNTCNYGMPYITKSWTSNVMSRCIDGTSRCIDETSDDRHDVESSGRHINTCGCHNHMSGLWSGEYCMNESMNE